MIPDFIPIFGYLDDLIIVPGLIALAVKLIPKKIMIVSIIRAENEPIQLKKNWTFGILFIVIWLIMVYLIIKSFI